VATDASRDQLAPCDDAMLAFGELPNVLVDLTRDAFARYGVVDASLIRHVAQTDASERT
jgi:hypothetical protein